MKIAVTGASGFIGSNLTQHLLDCGHEVIALSRSAPDSVDVKNANLKIIACDVRDKAALAAAMAGCDAVTHLAALFNSPESSAEEYHAINVTGTQNVLEVARDLGIKRVVHCSTVGVASGGMPPFPESAPYAPPEWDKYETTKAKAEQLAVEFDRDNELSVFIIRPAQVYGPGDLGKIKFYNMVKKGIIVRQGSTRKHLIYIDDLCRAFELACRSEQGAGLPMIIASPQSILLRDLVAIVAKALNTVPPKIKIPALPVTLLATVVEILFNTLGKKPPIFRRSMHFFTKSVEFEFANAKHYLGFETEISTEEGVNRTASWYRENGHI